MENTNTPGSSTPGSSQRSGPGNMPQDRRKDEEAGKKTGQQSQGGSSQDWQRDKVDPPPSDPASADEHDRLKDAARSGGEQSPGKSGQSGQSKRPDQSSNPSR